MYTLYILYTYVDRKQEKEDKTIMMTAVNDLDAKLAQLYQEKVTVNLEAKSTLSPSDFWSSMELIATNNKAVMNFKMTKRA